MRSRRPSLRHQITRTAGGHRGAIGGMLCQGPQRVGRAARNDGQGKASQPAVPAAPRRRLQCQRHRRSTSPINAGRVQVLHASRTCFLLAPSLGPRRPSLAQDPGGQQPLDGEVRWPGSTRRDLDTPAGPRKCRNWSVEGATVVQESTGRAGRFVRARDPSWRVRTRPRPTGPSVKKGGTDQRPVIGHRTSGTS